MSQEQQVRFVPITLDMSSALETSEAFAAEHELQVTADELDQLRAIVQQTLEFSERAGAVSPWGGYLAVDSQAERIVGCCGFKGNPTPEKMVEIAYFIFPEFEGQGFATAAAREIFAIADRSADAALVVAHTLPDRNASCRVLEKAGFHCVGDVIDPEDGSVWRWERIASGS